MQSTIFDRDPSYFIGFLKWEEILAKGKAVNYATTHLTGIFRIEEHIVTACAT